MLTEQQIKINRAIDRGLAYLKIKLEDVNASRFRAEQYQEGFIALLGLTLLECGVPANDPEVQQAAKTIRARASELYHTYSLATSILFLDRLGDKSDGGLIQSFALRLVAGQRLPGSWHYDCIILDPTEEQQFVKYLQSLRYQVKGIKQEPFNLTDLPRRLRQHPLVMAQLGRFPPVDRPYDNSNTQFAVLGLWVAQRHDLPVHAALGLAEKYFRNSQNADGSWLYDRDHSWRDSMTCAGLFGLAVGKSILYADGGQGGAADEGKDPAIEKGLRYLSRRIGSPVEANEGGGYIGADAFGDLYYLWSLERVAMVYDLKTIGGKDWYAWASDVIVRNQREDGSWSNAFPGPIDTCFALLVLKRVNVVQDLTTNIKKMINIKDLERASATPPPGNNNAGEK